MPDLKETLHAELVRYLVQKAVFCPGTGAVLDVRTCVVLVDADGDPAVVLSPEGWANVPEANRELLTGRGITVENA